MKNVTESKPQEQNQPMVNVLDHYIKSVHFDSTRNTPSFIGDVQPKTEIVIDVFTTDKGNNQHEVALHIKSNVTYQDAKIFSMDISYAGLCVLDGIIDADQEERILNIFCPNLIFPFARRVVADLTRDAGYPPMLINGVDFSSSYNAKNASKLKVN